MPACGTFDGAAVAMIVYRDLVDGAIAGGRYDLRGELGSGATATVWRAHDRSLGRDVAIKILHEAADREVARRFEREVRIASGLRHADVIEVFDSGVHHDRPFVVMELVTAPSLEAALGTPAISSVAAIGASIARLLAHAHGADIVHRDLKPANIFLEGTLAEPGRCRLSDFGLAFALNDGGPLGRFTADGVLLGTPLYMAPEQAEGGEVGTAVDIYALGCILHALVAGRPPFTGNVARVLAGHMYLPPIPLREIVPEVPAELERLVLAMLAKRPEERPVAEAVARQLAELAAEPRAVVLARPSLRGGRVAPSASSASPRSARPKIAIPDRELQASLGEALRARGIDVTEQAAVVLAPDGVAGRAAGQIVIVVHPRPSVETLSRAIRAGAAAVVRWPGSADHAAAVVASACEAYGSESSP